MLIVSANLILAEESVDTAPRHRQLIDWVDALVPLLLALPDELFDLLVRIRKGAVSIVDLL